MDWRIDEWALKLNYRWNYKFPMILWFGCVFRVTVSHRDKFWHIFWGSKSVRDTFTVWICIASHLFACNATIWSEILFITFKSLWCGSFITSSACHRHCTSLFVLWVRSLSWNHFMKLVSVCSFCTFQLVLFATSTNSEWICEQSWAHTTKKCKCTFSTQRNVEGILMISVKIWRPLIEAICKIKALRVLAY